MNFLRFLIVAGAISGLMLVGRSMGPRMTKADGIDPLPAPPVKGADRGIPMRDAEGRAFVGEFTSPTHSILIYADGEGPRYTIRTPGGTVLARDLRSEDVYRQFPDLDLSNLHFGPDTHAHADHDKP